MRASARWIIIGLATIFVAFSARYIWYGAPVATAYTAKSLCTGVFVSGRSPEHVLSNEIKVDGQPALIPVRAAVDIATATASADYPLGTAERTALFRDGLGCTLAIDVEPEILREQARGYVPPPTPESQPWPAERLEPARQRALTALVDYAFQEPDPEEPVRTRALLVIHRGAIVAERYAAGFGPRMPLTGWSMTKSVMGLLVGIAVEDGNLQPEQPIEIPGWQADGDPRSQITLDHLLRMTDGLAFDEDYHDPLGDVIQVSWATGDRAAFTAGKHPNHEPGTFFNYSSGTSHLLGKVLQQGLQQPLHDYWRYPHLRLFHPLGMTSALMPPDASGRLAGGSFMTATARDWARIGQLMLQNGRWQGHQVVSSDWIQYMLTPTPEATRWAYGAHIWLELPAPYFDPDNRRDLPDDAYHLVGHWGQFVSVIPSRDLIVVRLGLAMGYPSWNQEAFLARLISVFDSA